MDEVLRRLIPKQKTGRYQTDWRVQRLILFVNEHLDCVDWKLEKACRELKLGITAPHAARLFKRGTGVGIREYAKRMRLAIAADRLIETDLPVKVIAMEFGYRQPFDFARRFKAQYQVSPTEFRKRSA
jgi:AraC-like DNA-binding protein